MMKMETDKIMDETNSNAQAVSIQLARQIGQVK